MRDGGVRGAHAPVRGALKLDVKPRAWRAGRTTLGTGTIGPCGGLGGGAAVFLRWCCPALLNIPKGGRRAVSTERDSP